ncbi:hypothetical protein BC826DRAFT_507912 [Russula brevipes]|nr:hypothetical protein BC826DRAFT_507912 [Russula brevipes]
MRSVWPNDATPFYRRLRIFSATPRHAINRSSMSRAHGHMWLYILQRWLLGLLIRVSPDLTRGKASLGRNALPSTLTGPHRPHPAPHLARVVNHTFPRRDASWPFGASPYYLWDFYPLLLLPMLHISRATQHFAGVLATRTCPRQPLRPFLAARLALRSPSWLSIGWDDS